MTQDRRRRRSLPMAALIYAISVSLVALVLLYLGQGLTSHGLLSITPIEAWITAVPLGIPLALLIDGVTRGRRDKTSDKTASLAA